MPGMETTHAERIFLLGPTAAGKSTVGARVAAMLGWRFVDLDSWIERRAGLSIGEIFARGGEPRFRELETAALAEAASEARTIIATGGGIVERDANLTLVRACGWSVTLAVTPETSWQRARDSATAARVPLGDIRPLLAGDDPLGRLQVLHARRSAAYSRADEVLVADAEPPEVLAARVVAGLVGRGLLSPDGAAERVRRVRTSAAGSYEVVVAWASLPSLGERLHALGLPPRLHVVADATVATLYEPALMSALMRAGFAPSMLRVPPGEGSKSREQLNAIHDWLAERRAERGEGVVALGGGVVGDLAGFAAATYLRGLPLIQVPTTLLAQLDASIGGKVAIDHPRGKNLIGAFYPPRLVLSDPAVLLTLPARVRAEGWAEAVKHGVALEAGYFDLLQREAEALVALKPGPLVEAIGGSVCLKAAVVEADEREGEGGQRALLNYGHTIGHAIEAVAGYGAWLHGEAVAAGMAAAGRLGRHRGITPDDVVERQEALLSRFALPVRADGLRARDLLRATLWDKKARGGQVRWVLPSAFGAAALYGDVPEPDVRAALLEIGAADDVPPAVEKASE